MMKYKSSCKGFIKTLLLGLCFCHTSIAQSKITRIEYYIDADPGYGNATNVTGFTANANVTYSFPPISTISLSAGLHTIGVRSRTDSGAWSFDEKWLFYKPSSTTLSSNITRIEYYIDADPGYGSATAITNFTAATDVAPPASNINITALAAGLHTIGVRSRNAAGQWSFDEKWLFYKPSSTTSSLSNITRIEYYIDADPGYGRATAISNFTPATDVAPPATTINITSLSAGLHTIGMRSRNAAGQWSLDEKWIFYKNPSTLSLSNINRIEYYIDSDPGYGNATVITSYSSSDDVSNAHAVIPSSSISCGLHIIAVRSRNAAGQWSLDERWLYYKSCDTVTVLPDIVRIEYYKDVDPGYGKATAITPFSAGKDIIASIPTSSLEKAFIIGIRSLDAKGHWSIDERHCFGLTPSPAFNFAISARDVSFVDGSKYSSIFKWTFGDGSNSQVNNPLHTYSHNGNYMACLTTGNICKAALDTLCKTVIIKGLNEINTNHGGNKGFVNVNISGGGFVAGMHIYLRKAGQVNIDADTIFLESGALIKTSFNLQNKTLGTWDVVAVYPGSDTSALINGFTIEPPSPPQLWVNITGDYVLRVGFNQIYTVTYGNTGNTDAFVVPLTISGLPLGTEIEILDPLTKIDSIPGRDSAQFHWDSSHSFTVQDTIQNMSFRWFYIGNIPAGSSSSISFIFHLPLNASLHSTPTVEVALGEPLYQSDSSNMSLQTSEESEPSIVDCSLALMKKVGKIVWEGINYTKWVNCAVASTASIHNAYTSFRDFGREPHHSPWGVVSFAVAEFVDFNKDFVDATLKCSYAAGLTAAVSEYKLLYLLGSVAIEAFKDPGYVIECTKTFRKKVWKKIKRLIGNAWDPNDKYGPGDNSLSHYVSDTAHLSYVINFENDAAANLPAQTVTVIDTLNPAYFDYKTFGFTFVSIGDSFYRLPYPMKSFYHDFNFVAGYGVRARVTAIFDTTTGIAKWAFNSIDPTTNQPTTNALAGFLPPDVISPKGQGYVSYTVAAKPTLHTGDTIKNRASIIFDYNDPIVTNVWQNVLDLVKPVSHVNALPSITRKKKFKLSWTGSDNMSGVDEYGIYMSVNDSAFQPFKIGTTQLTDTVLGENGNKYSFYSIARDNAGNIEQAKNNAEAITTVILYLIDSICPGQSTFFVSDNVQAGNTYRWQMDNGSGFTNLANSTNYSGVLKDTLRLLNMSTSNAENQYRCVVTKNAENDTTSVHVLHFVNKWKGATSTAWETASNWSCGIVPDSLTDVIIPAGVPYNPYLNSNRSCRSLNMEPSAFLNVKQGFILKLTGRLIEIEK